MLPVLLNYSLRADFLHPLAVSVVCIKNKFFTSGRKVSFSSDVSGLLCFIHLYCYFFPLTGVVGGQIASFKKEEKEKLQWTGQ